MITNNRRTILLKIKKKKELYVNLVHFIQGRAVFRSLIHGTVSSIRNHFSKMIKNLSIICMF